MKSDGSRVEETPHYPSRHSLPKRHTAVQKFAYEHETEGAPRFKGYTLGEPFNEYDSEALQDNGRTASMDMSTFPGNV